MKHNYIIIIAFLFTSCMARVIEEKEEANPSYDSVIAASHNLHDSILVYIPKVDKKIVKTITVRDTVYIKEKTNFWGKKKVTTDSAQSVDSTVIEND